MYCLHRLVSAPALIHSAAVLQIMRYICGSLFKSLLLSSSSPLVLRAYSDSDWAVDATDANRLPDFVFFLEVLLLLEK